MKKKKRNRKSKLHPLIVDRLKQRKQTRSLGYENTNDYEKGLSTIKRLLAQKDKPVEE